MNGEPPSPAQPGRRDQGHDGLILAIACVAQFMVVLDVDRHRSASLDRPGPALQRDRTAGVVNAYVLTFAGFLLLCGRAADLFGQRRVYLSGMALFTVAAWPGASPRIRPS